MQSQLTNAVLRAIRRILRATDQRGRKLAAATNLTPSQLLVLQEIERRGETTPGAIAHNLHFGQATVTNIIDRLEAQNFVTRQRNERDKRQILLGITAGGLTAIRMSPDPLQQQFSAGFEDLSTWEQAMILAALERVCDLMGATDIDAAPLLDSGTIDRSPA